MKYSDYAASFVFGFKLFSLLFLLVAPIVIWFFALSWGSKIIESVPLLHVPELRILSARTTPYDQQDPLGIRPETKEHVYTMNFTENGDGTTREFKLYVRTSRETHGDEELKRLKRAMQDILNKDHQATVLTGGGLSIEIPYFDSTVTYARSTPIGTLINYAGWIGLTICSLALYFPLLKGIFDLLRRRRVMHKK